MQRQIDESTWLGTASGYQQPLYYHLEKVDYGLFKGIEWHCGFEYGTYHQVYPVLVFPAEYVDPERPEPGAYLHWLSFVDPARRTPMIVEGLSTAHTAECRALKAVLERGEGRRGGACGRYVVQSETLYVDAPVRAGAEYLADVRSMNEYAFLLRPNGDVAADEGAFVDEYDRPVVIRSRMHARDESLLIEQDTAYPEHGDPHRSVTLLVPCSHAFGQPAARGFIKHRVTFRPVDDLRQPAPRHIDELRAESINVKRLLEARAGNLETFARGLSYLPEATEPR